jgi:hypothetical protein
MVSGTNYNDTGWFLRTRRGNGDWTSSEFGLNLSTWFRPTWQPVGSTVLVAGGGGFQARGRFVAADFTSDRAYEFDPATETFTPVASLPVGRGYHSSTLLEDGSVLLAGGVVPTAPGDPPVPVETTPSAVRYVAGTWQATGAMSLARCWHTAERLADGRVIVLGGTTRAGADPFPTGFTEIFDPATGTWSEGPELATPRFHHRSVALPDGTVVVVGGHDADYEPLASVEVLDPGASAWRSLGDLPTAVAHPAVWASPSGRVVLVLGGSTGLTETNNLVATTAVSALDTLSEAWSVWPDLPAARVFPVATTQPDGRLLVLGGLGYPSPVVGGDALATEVIP